MRQRSFFVLMAGFSALLLSCADRRESVAREHLRDQIASQSNGALMLSSMAKANGYDHERDGMKLYTLEWKADLQVQADTWKAGWKDYRVSAGEPNAFEAAVSGASVKRLFKGTTAAIQGKSTLQKADRGWRVVDAEVTGLKLTPPAALTALLGTWRNRSGNDVFRIEQAGDDSFRYTPGTLEAPGSVSWSRSFKADYSNGNLTIRFAEGSATVTRRGPDNELVITEEDAFGERAERAIPLTPTSSPVAVESTPQLADSNASPSETPDIPNYRASTFLNRFGDIDTRRLRASDLDGLSASELGLLRNFIYARHGRPFTKPAYQRYFSQFSWYRPNSSYSDGMLNEIERANVVTIEHREVGRSPTN